MKRLSHLLFVLFIVVLVLPTVVMAQTGGPVGETTSLCPGGLLGDLTETDFTSIIDLIGYGPEGGTRVGVLCSSRFETLSINTRDALDVSCSSVVAYQMNNAGQLHKVESSCADDVLSLPVSANTHFFLYTFGRGPGSAQELVELSVEL
jgi:hypothetical protein